MTPVKMQLMELDQDGYHLFIHLKVNGRRCRFLIDTGASKSVIDKKYYERYLSSQSKLITLKQETASLHGSVPETYMGRINEIALGKHKITGYQVAAVDLSHVNATYAALKAPKIHGILGSDLMMRYQMVIDYGQAKIFIP